MILPGLIRPWWDHLCLSSLCGPRITLLSPQPSWCLFCSVYDASDGFPDVQSWRIFWTQHSPASSSYWALFFSKASSIQSSLGIVNSSKSACLVVSDTRSMSGLSVVSAMFSGDLSCLPRWTFSVPVLYCFQQSTLVASGAGVASARLWQSHEPLHWLLLSTAGHPSADDLCNDLQHLVMALGQELNPVWLRLP